MLIIAKYTLVEAYKRRLILLFGLTLITSLAIGGYAAGLAVVSKQSTLAAFYGFCIRIGAVLILGAYLILSESKALESDNAFISLGLPIQRARYLTEKWAAYMAIALCLALLSGMPLAAMPVSAATLLAWTVSLYCELAIIVTIALMLSVIFTQPLLSLVTLVAFYLFARGSGEFSRHSTYIIDGQAGGMEMMAWIVKIATLAVPRLDHFAPTPLLLYDLPGEVSWLPVLTQTFLFTALLLAVSVDRLQQKRF